MSYPCSIYTLFLHYTLVCPELSQPHASPSTVLPSRRKYTNIDQVGTLTRTDKYVGRDAIDVVNSIATDRLHNNCRHSEQCIEIKTGKAIDTQGVSELVAPCA